MAIQHRTRRAYRRRRRAHASFAETIDAAPAMHRPSRMHWTRRHPYLAWFGLVLIIAFWALFVRDVGIRRTGPTSGTLVVLGIAILAIIVSFVLSFPMGYRRRPPPGARQQATR
jgi:hypothetical protein